MAELIGVNLATHLESILAEFKAHETIYGYPKRKMYLGFPGLDLGVNFHGRRAETILGPASGPHTQMAQNIILAFLGGSRIMELKTVQILDQLDIPRPCIDIRNVGYNIEWSQEFRLADSLNEYILAWVLLKLLEETEVLGIPKGSSFYDTIFDISVGYDLKGIKSRQMHDWLVNFKNAGAAIDQILESLPSKFNHLKKTKIEPNISNSVTLSTFHGCPADEIESIVEHLIDKHQFHVIVKMNPTVLGYDNVDRILHKELGYKDIQLDPDSFEHDVSFDDAVALMKRLRSFAKKRGRNLGAKFTNTLIVKNNQAIFKDEVMYLSGAPLHVLAMTAMHDFRNEMGAEFPISFSAGISKHNFVDAVACNMTPVSTCTDLLKEGGYTRLFDYLRRLKEAMGKAQCMTISDFVLSGSSENSVVKAGLKNSGELVKILNDNPLYHQNSNKKSPPKIDSHLELFDCITCNKCLPVCPNAANFSIETGVIEWPMVQINLSDGKFETVKNGVFKLDKKSQIANLADFCNECGDCDTYCPEFGGPFIEKPRFFFSEQSYQQFSSYDGFYFPTRDSMKGRIGEQELLLSFDRKNNNYIWENGTVKLTFDTDNQFISGETLKSQSHNRKIDSEPFYVMRALFDGMKRNPDNFAALMLAPK